MTMVGLPVHTTELSASLASIRITPGLSPTAAAARNSAIPSQFQHHGHPVEKDCSLLSRFLLISFADLKQWCFHFWFASQALVPDPPARLPSLMPASKWLSVEQAESVSAACKCWRNSSNTADVPFFILRLDLNSHATVIPLSEWEACNSSLDFMIPHTIQTILVGLFATSLHFYIQDGSSILFASFATGSPEVFQIWDRHLLMWLRFLYNKVDRR